MKASRQYDIFQLAKDLNPVIKRGMLGVILEVLDSKNYEVEFIQNDGNNYEYDGNYTFTIDNSFFEDIQIINLQPISSIGELHRTFSNELKFPEFYGMNWDAFWDTITGIVEMPKILKLTRWKEFSVRFPDDSKVLKEITHDFNRQFHEKKILIEE
jgi:ribonuclease inhibitor